MYTYVPGTVSVTLNMLFVHWEVLGLGLGEMVAPLGTDVKFMSWVLVSLLTNTIVVPGNTEMVLGTKLFGWLALPAPSGMVTSTVGAEEDVLGVGVVLVVTGVEDVEDVVAVLLEGETDVTK